MIRVCLVDDQALIRSGLRALLSMFDGIEVIAEATDGETAIGTVIECKPDVLLLDVRMPKLHGVQVINALVARAALPPTLLLTTFEDDAALVAGIRAGAKGFLLKGVTAEILVEGIRTVAAGGTFLYASAMAKPEDVNMQPESGWRQDVFEDPEQLTLREREVLKLMTSGISNAQIAKALKLSDGTVRNHVSNVLSKLGVTDRTKAVLVALQRQLV